MEKDMNRHVMAWVIPILVLVLGGGCVVPGGAGTGTGSGKAPGSAGKAVMKVCGRSITGEDLVKSPNLRRGLREYIYYITLEEEGVKQGITVDPADIESQRKMILDTVMASNKTWEEFLESQSLTDAEWEEQARLSLLMIRLAEQRAGITEDDYREKWQADRENIVTQYIRRYHAPEIERDNVTYEDCLMVIKEIVFRDQAMMHFDSIQKELMNSATLELLGGFSKDEAVFYEDLILYSVQTADQGGVSAGSLSGGSGASSAPEAGQVELPQHDHGEDAVPPADEDDIEITDQAEHDDRDVGNG